MNAPSEFVGAEEAYDDLSRRTLAKIPGELGRLIYLASTRDYNTGSYHHDGLAARFRQDLAAKALAAAHRRIFYALAVCSLEELTGELETYVNASRQTPEEVVHVWQKLEPYRVALPVDVNPAIARLFVSNVRVALAVLRARHQASLMDRSAA
jgi:hypothetical protein